MPFQTLDLAAFCGGCIIFAGSLRRFLDKAQDKAKLKFMGMVGYLETFLHQAGRTT